MIKVKTKHGQKQQQTHSEEDLNFILCLSQSEQEINQVTVTKE